MILETGYKGKIIRFSAYSIDDENNFEFSPDDYSKFKYGADNIAQKFGYTLAYRFIQNCLESTYNGKQIVVLPSAYSYIPTASFRMKTYFIHILNRFLYQNNYPIVQETKINRTVTYREDYGEMSAKERYNLISGDTFHYDRSFTADKILLFLDDIKITGTHERIIIDMLNKSNADNDCYMLYFAELNNHNIHPSIENILNNHCISSLQDIQNIILNEKFKFNTRVVKYILNSPHSQFKQFLKNQKPQFINELYNLAIGNEYYKFDSYISNIRHLEQEYIS